MRIFAVIPAAGHSRRMGQPKLLLPLGDKPVIVRLLDVLDRREIADRVVVVRPNDKELTEAVVATGATLVVPTTAPPDMRTSVQHALDDIRRRHNPSPDDGWLLTPADHPMLDRTILDKLLDRWRQNSSPVLVPTYHGRRGHPTLFRWELAEEVESIPPDRGLNWLLTEHASDVVEFAVDSSAVVTDLDTPEDYERLANHVSKEAWDTGRKD